MQTMHEKAKLPDLPDDYTLVTRVTHERVLLPDGPSKYILVRKETRLPDGSVTDRTWDIKGIEVGDEIRISDDKVITVYSLRESGDYIREILYTTHDTERFKKLMKEDPEAAREEARRRLIRIGLIDEDGNRLPPYRDEDPWPYCPAEHNTQKS